MSTLTSAVYRAIEQYTAENGFPPSVRDLMEATAINTTSVVKYHLDKLKTLGIITWDQHKSRTMRILKPLPANLDKQLDQMPQHDPSLLCAVPGCQEHRWRGPNGLNMALTKCEGHQREEWRTAKAKKRGTPLVEKVGPSIQLVVKEPTDPAFAVMATMHEVMPYENDISAEEWQQTAEALTQEHLVLYEEMRRFEAMKSEVLRLREQKRLVYGKTDLNDLFMMVAQDMPEETS